MQKSDMETFYPMSQKEWRTWLEKHHESKQSIWLVHYKKSTGKPSVAWSDAVDEALCFGWIDSTRKTLDAETFIQFFSKRKPNGTWSKINKEKIKQLVATGKMRPAGLKVIETAKQNGSWTILDEVEELIVPHDLEIEFRGNPEVKAFFLTLSKSVQKALLQWLVLAKRPETRKKRICEIVVAAVKKRKPKQFE